jgi:hypothetical protein
VQEYDAHSCVVGMRKVIFVLIYQKGIIDEGTYHQYSNEMSEIKMVILEHLFAY